MNEAEHWHIMTGMIPEPAITVNVEEKGVTTIGVAWSARHAEFLFNLYQEIPVLVLCVKVPMCRYVTDVASAVAFFNDEGWQG